MRISMTFDCTDARAQARFWATALDYEEAPPPAGWTSWEDWLRDNDVPEAEWNDGAWLRDPEGVRPAISFLKVPEPKTAKNRIHIDLQVSGGRHLDQTERASRRSGPRPSNCWRPARQS